MDISFKDAQRLWSGIWHKKKLVNKKRRWLMQLPSQETDEVVLKKFKKLRSSSNTFLAESFVRRDEVSSEAVKINIERNYNAVCFTEEWLHDFHNYMVLSDVYILQSFFLEPSNLLKFYSRLDLLSNNALELLVKIIAEEKINFERTRPGMKKVIKNYFPNALSASKDSALVATLRQLYEILKNPEICKEKQPSIISLGCLSILPSIYKALELLDNMPLLALCAFNRKLKGKMMVPQFPPSQIGYNKKTFVDQIKRRFQKLILTLDNENSMPAALVKAMSIIHLYFKYKTKCSETFTTKFFSFSVETITLQSYILKALWSISKVASHQVKALQTILGVKLGGDSSSFLTDLKRYLMQYLLECDEIEIPRDFSNILDILNQNSCSQPQICSRETIEVETEAVLNVSIELKHVLSPLLSCNNTDEKAAESLESDDETKSNDFELTENDYCCNPLKYQRQQRNDFSINDELETTGDSMPGTFFSSATSDSCIDVQLSEASKSINHGFIKKQTKEQDSIDDLIPHYKESMDTSLQSISIKELCDETSLVSYRLIGRMLNSFLLVDGRDVDVTTRHHLTGEALHSLTSQDDKDVLDSSGENVGIEFLMHSIEDLLPFISKRCTQRLEKLMKQP